jgi:hypothetical protein
MPDLLPTENEAQRLAGARAAMARTRELAGTRKALTAGIFDAGGVGDWEDTPPYARSIALACRLCRTSDSRAGFRDLVLHVEAHAGRLLHGRAADGQTPQLLVLQRLAERHPEWRRRPEVWRPRHGNAAQQLRQLAGHLLGREAGDVFVDGMERLEPNERVGLWFGHLGRGQNARTETPRPLYVSKKIAYHFFLAPAHYDLIRALRWGQVYGLGGGTRLAKAIDFTRLAWQIWEPPDEEWWAGVLQWLANQPELDPLQVTPIIDFVHSQRYGDPEVQQPPSPEFSMKGRAPQPLLRLIEEWHDEIASRKTHVHTEFRRSGVRPGRWEIESDGVLEAWTVEEILDSTALREEGRKMRHCVATYLASVEKGKCSVWSMRTRRGDMVRRATTIQLSHASRRIVQCRGHCNRMPKKAEKRILQLWAKENGLRVDL